MDLNTVIDQGVTVTAPEDLTLSRKGAIKIKAMESDFTRLSGEYVSAGVLSLARAATAGNTLELDGKISITDATKGVGMDKSILAGVVLHTGTGTMYDATIRTTNASSMAVKRVLDGATGNVSHEAAGILGYGSGATALTLQGVDYSHGFKQAIDVSIVQKASADDPTFTASVMAYGIAAGAKIENHDGMLAPITVKAESAALGNIIADALLAISGEIEIGDVKGAINLSAKNKKAGDVTAVGMQGTSVQMGNLAAPLTVQAETLSGKAQASGILSYSGDVVMGDVKKAVRVSAKTKEGSAKAYGFHANSTASIGSFDGALSVKAISQKEIINDSVEAYGFYSDDNLDLEGGKGAMNITAQATGAQDHSTAVLFNGGTTSITGDLNGAATVKAIGGDTTTAYYAQGMYFNAANINKAIQVSAENRGGEEVTAALIDGSVTQLLDLNGAVTVEAKGATIANAYGFLTNYLTAGKITKAIRVAAESTKDGRATGCGISVWTANINALKGSLTAEARGGIAAKAYGLQVSELTVTDGISKAIRVQAQTGREGGGAFAFGFDVAESLSLNGGMKGGLNVEALAKGGTSTAAATLFKSKRMYVTGDIANTMRASAKSSKSGIASAMGFTAGNGSTVSLENLNSAVTIESSVKGGTASSTFCSVSSGFSAQELKGSLLVSAINDGGGRAEANGFLNPASLGDINSAVTIESRVKGGSASSTFASAQEFIAGDLKKSFKVTAKSSGNGGAKTVGFSCGTVSLGDINSAVVMESSVNGGTASAQFATGCALFVAGDVKGPFKVTAKSSGNGRAKTVGFSCGTVSLGDINSAVTVESSVKGGSASAQFTSGATLVAGDVKGSLHVSAKNASEGGAETRGIDSATVTLGDMDMAVAIVSSVKGGSASAAFASVYSFTAQKMKKSLLVSAKNAGEGKAEACGFNGVYVRLNGDLDSAVTIESSVKGGSASAEFFVGQTFVAEDVKKAIRISAQNSGNGNVEACVFDGMTVSLGSVKGAVSVEAVAKKGSAEAGFVDGSNLSMGSLAGNITVRATGNQNAPTFLPSSTAVSAEVLNAEHFLTLAGDITGNLSAYATNSGIVGGVNARVLYSDDPISINGDITGNLTAKAVNYANRANDYTYASVIEASTVSLGNITGSLRAEASNKNSEQIDVYAITADELYTKGKLGTLTAVANGSGEDAKAIALNTEVISLTSDAYLTGKLSATCKNGTAVGMKTGYVRDYFYQPFTNEVTATASLDITATGKKAIGIEFTNATNATSLILRDSKLTAKTTDKENGSAFALYAGGDTLAQNIQLNHSTLTGDVMLDAGDDSLVLKNQSKITGAIDLGTEVMDWDKLEIHSGSKIKGDVSGVEFLELVLDDPSAKFAKNALWEGSSLAVDNNCFSISLSSDALNPGAGVTKTFTLLKDLEGDAMWSNWTAGINLDGTQALMSLACDGTQQMAAGYEFKLFTGKDGKSMQLAVTKC